MDHFSPNAWADFTRGIGANQGIKAHLMSGCLKCKTAQGFWTRLQTVAIADRTYSAPEDLVRLAKLEFSARAELDHAWTPASTLFDSFSLPLCAGVRGAYLWPRQVVYQAEGLTIDIQLDRAAQPGKVSAIGQILDNQTAFREPMNAASLVLWTGDGRLVATSTPNVYGEFQLEFDAQDNLRLTARVGSRRVRMSLVELQ
jgi:hypothetical protein